MKHGLSGVTATSGIGLGDKRQKIERLLGVPSQTRRFRDAEMLWYLGKPEHVTTADPLDQNNYRGYAAAYVLKVGEVVEIFLHAWSNEAGA